ncbi:MAG: DoxX family protein, partial [Deltaproteobacteria bacterium]|nr:DoxX family protein [Deltaproteobacteria bacterium]
CAIVGWATWYGNAREGVVAIRLVIGLLFAWAGLHKVNPAFVANGMGAIVAQWGWPAPPPWVNVAIAVIEVALGVGLLVPRTRRIAAYGLVVWSLTVALGLSAMGLNRAVVPWNVGHAVMSMWLARAPSSPAHEGWSWARRPSLLVVATVFGAMPALHVLGWPPYLALRLYTGSSPIALLHLNEPEVLPAAARRVARREESGTFRAVLDVQRWAHEATGAFVPPENAVFEGVLGHVCRRVRRPREVLLVVVERDEHWRRAPETRYLRCADVIADIP